MKGKIVLITGSSDGIGKQTAIELAVFGATVLLHARTAETGSRLLTELQLEIPSASFDLFVADFEQQHEVQQMAGEIKASYNKLDVLVNNAAMCAEEKTITLDTIEKTFAVNHLAPFLLTHLLLPLLQNAPQARVINVSSQLHFSGKFDVRNLQGERKYNGIHMYCSTKLYNLLFTYEMASKLKHQHHITINAVHPGMLATNLYLKLFDEFDGAMAIDAADTVVYLCSSPEVSGVTGEYFISRVPVQSSHNSYSRKYRKQLWKLSEQLTRIQSGEFLFNAAKPAETKKNWYYLLRKFLKIETKEIKQKGELHYPVH